MKDVYLRAAARIDANDNTFSCVAIDIAVTDIRFYPPTTLESKAYCALFSKRNRDTTRGRWGDEWGDTNEERKQCRVLALLFMHWITVSEGKNK